MGKIESIDRQKQRRYQYSKQQLLSLLWRRHSNLRCALSFLRRTFFSHSREWFIGEQRSSLSQHDGGCENPGKSCERPNANGDFEPTEVGMSISTSGTLSSIYPILNSSAPVAVTRSNAFKVHATIA